MRTTIYDGYLRARTPISHGGDVRGVELMFNRTKSLDAEGRTTRIPIINGGNIRGSLRRRAAAMVWEALGGDPLPYPTMHLLATGGTITATKSAQEVLTSERQAVLRDLVPLIEVFGGSGGGRVMSGRLTVDKAIPIAADTMLGRPLPPGATAARTATEVLGLQYNSCFPGVPDSTVEAQPEDTTLAGTGLFRYGTETMVPGTCLWHTIQLEDATPRAQQFFADVLAAWRTLGPHVGGGHSRGYGAVECHYTCTTYTPGGCPAEPEVPEVGWREYLAENKAAALEALAWAT